MGISRDEKQYWIEAIKDEIRRKQTGLLATVNLTREDIFKFGADAYIADLGLTDEIAKLRAIETELDQAKARVNVLEAEKRGAKDILRAKISGIDYYSDLSDDDIAKTKAGREYQRKAISALPIGEQYLKLEDDKSQIERAIMLVNTSAEMKGFVEKYLKSLGVDLLGEN